MSGQHCESYDVKRETVHCYPVNSSLLTAVERNGWNLCAVFKFCFCFVLLYNKSLNDWSLGEQSLSVNYQINSHRKVNFFLPDIIHSEVMVSAKFHEKPSKELRMILFKSLHIWFRCVPSVLLHS